MAENVTQDEFRDRPIGVFDSGLGGLTVVRELSRVMPSEDILYFGDTARNPYGPKSPDTIRGFCREIAGFLLAQQPKMLVIACNTASSVAREELERGCPVEIVDVIQPGAAAAVELAATGRIAVIGTEGTVASGAYQRAIAALDAKPGREVMAVACPLLVPIVEEGRSEFDPIVLSVLSEYLRDVQRFRPGALILGCTHYPLLADAIGRVMGPAVPLVNSAAAAAKEAARRLSLRGLDTRRHYAGRLICYTTDTADRFARLGERFGGRRIDAARSVPMDELEKSSLRCAT